MGFQPISYEARCLKCGETFVPNDEDDLIHAFREDGTECGGEADPASLGAWGIHTPTRQVVTWHRSRGRTSSRSTTTPVYSDRETVKRHIANRVGISVDEVIIDNITPLED